MFRAGRIALIAACIPLAVQAQTYAPPQPLLQAIGTITSNQLKALNSSPPTAIAAPGSGKHIEVIGMSAKYVYGGTAYVGTNNVLLQYAAGVGVPAVVISGANMIGAVSVWSSGIGKPTSAVGGSTSGIDNAALQFTCPVTDFITGNGTINYTILYTIVSD